MNSDLFNKAFNIIIASVAVTSVLFPKLIGLAFAVWILAIIFGLIRKEIVFVIPSKISVFFWVLFLMYLIGAVFTKHPDIAGKYIEYKLSLFAIPLLFVFQPRQIKLEIIKKGFILAVFVLSIYYFLNVIFLADFSQGLSAVTSSNFSTLHHPSYFSVFAFFAMILTIQLFVQSRKKTTKLILGGLILFFILTQLMCISLAGLLFLMLFSVFFGLYLSHKIFGKKGVVTAFILVPVILFSAFKFVPGFKTQFVVSKQYFVEYVQSPTEFVQSKKTYLGGNETRLILWTATFQEILKHPLGVGTGNTDDYIASRLRSLGQNDMALKQYNPHNQYLQTALEIGVLVALVLILILVSGIVSGFRNKNWLLVLLTLSLGFNCLFESMLQRQSGIVFYVFWIVLFSNSFGSNQSQNKLTNE